jgi:regulatory protein
MIITRIERQKRHPDRVNVYVDGDFAFGLSEEVWFRFGLRKGDTIDPGLRSTLTGAEELTRARRDALRLLNYRMRSEHELRTRLREKEYPPDCINGVIAHLERLGLINDLEYARMLLRDMRLRKPSGTRLLKLELRRRGISDDVTRKAIEGEEAVNDGEAAMEAARQALRKFRSTIRKTDPKKQKERLAGFLARRGFSWSTIAPILKSLFPADQSPEDY